MDTRRFFFLLLFVKCFCFLFGNFLFRIEPFIYESIVLPEDFERGHQRLKLYQRTFRSRPKEFYRRNVRRIYTNNTLRYKSSSFEIELLKVCDNLTSLECWSDARKELSAILKTKSWPDLKTLCIDIDLLPQDKSTFHLPIFKNVTHLDFSSESPVLPSWESLESLENLTHLRVYMLVDTKSKEYRQGVDRTYAIATEARKYFPPNLKYFVILIPVDLLYYIMDAFSKDGDDEPEDDERWERFEDLRLGTFDPRIVLGCSGNWDDWFDGSELSDVEEDQIKNLVTYTGLMPLFTYPRWPRDHLDEDEMDTWKDVELKDRRRKAFAALLASKKK